MIEQPCPAMHITRDDIPRGMTVDRFGAALQRIGYRLLRIGRQLVAVRMH